MDFSSGLASGKAKTGLRPRRLKVNTTGLK